MEMQDPRALTERVADLVREGADEDLREVLKEQPAEVLADLLEHADPSSRDTIFSAIEPHLAGETAALVDETVLEDLLEDIPTDQLVEMVSDLEPDEALPLLEEVDAETADAVLRRLDPEDASELRELLGYDEESAGRIMAFGAPAVTEQMTLGEALSHLRAAADELDELQAVFVVDSIGRLRGYLPLDALLLRPAATAVADVMRRDVTFAYTNEDREQAAARAQRSHLLAIPVIDNRGILRGQITQEKLREIAEEEASEDMYHLAGVAEDESVYTSFRQSLQKRLPWLYVNLVTAVLAAWVISLFEGTIEKVAALAALQTIVAGQGGNAGIQALTVTVRALALGDLDWRNSRRTFYKELGLGVANGLAVGLVIGLLVWLWRGNIWMGGVIFAAMLLNMTAAALAGFSVPVLLRALRLDPAQSSGVFVTTVTDVCGFFFFLGLATLFLPYLRGI